MRFSSGPSRSGKAEARKVEAMVGICVHDPALLLEPPSNVSKIARESLARSLRWASLAQDAKTAYMIARGGMPFEESERQARVALPYQMQTWMRAQGLEPDVYEYEFFDESLRNDVKVLWGVATRSRPVGTRPMGPYTRIVLRGRIMVASLRAILRRWLDGGGLPFEETELEGARRFAKGVLIGIGVIAFFVLFSSYDNQPSIAERALDALWR